LGNAGVNAGTIPVLKHIAVPHASSIPFHPCLDCSTAHCADGVANATCTGGNVYAVCSNGVCTGGDVDAARSKGDRTGISACTDGDDRLYTFLAP